MGVAPQGRFVSLFLLDIFQDSAGGVGAWRLNPCIEFVYLNVRVVRGSSKIYLSRLLQGLGSHLWCLQLSGCSNDVCIIPNRMQRLQGRALSAGPGGRTKFGTWFVRCEGGSLSCRFYV